jgi:hypothetical protein
VADRASLIMPDGSERELGPEFAVGRAEDNDLTIDKPTVSRHHLVVTEEGDRWFVEDRGSFNGTFPERLAYPGGIESRPLRRPHRLWSRERGLVAPSLVTPR